MSRSMKYNQRSNNFSTPLGPGRTKRQPAPAGADTPQPISLSPGELAVQTQRVLEILKPLNSTYQAARILRAALELNGNLPISSR